MTRPDRARRRFLQTLGALSVCGTGGCRPASQPPLPPGELLGPAIPLGHRLRDGMRRTPESTRRTGILIVGAGISGLSAAWWLARNGIDDFTVLDMEAEPGGNSRGGQSPVSAYPWGAHYLPLPGPQAVWVRELLAELGVLQDSTTATKPRYDERYLCATPQERLYRHGLWQEGLLPQHGISRDERAQQVRFAERMHALKHTRGRDGRLLFTLPMALSSRDPDWQALDRISFRQWLDDAGYTASTLRWLADYACRDDYGTASGATSAWAGLHYFACRNGEAQHASDDTVLTAPDGNGWLARGLARAAEGRLFTDALVWRVEEEKSSLAVDAEIGGKSVRFAAQKLIWAAPVFLLPHVWVQMPTALQAAARTGDYAPWLIANLHLADFPEERHGAPPAWDNVLYESSGLGYVVATHQLLRRHQSGTVFTYYRALSDLAPAAGRRLLLDTNRDAWAEGILAELSGIHPNIRQLTTRLDVYRNGHAMRRPVPGSLFHGERGKLTDFRHPRIALAHADLSGFSLFEEAQYRGVMAAEQVYR